MAAVGITSFQTLFQTLYPERDLTYLVPKNLPLLHMINKSEDLSGDLVDHAFLYSSPAGYSQDFATALAQSGAAPGAARAAIRVSQAYAALDILDKDLELSRGSASYGDLLEKMMTGKMKTFLSNLDMDLHGGGNGWRGTVQAVAGSANPFTPGTNVPANSVAVATAFPLEAVFEIGQSIKAATWTGYPLAGSIFPPADGSAPTSLSAAVTVTAVDPMARTITLSSTTGFTAGAFIVQDGGTLGFSSSNLTGTFIGLDSWVPYAGVTSSDNFNGLNRSAYKARMTGYWYDGSRLSVEDAVKRLGAIMAQGGATDSNVCLMNPLDLDALDSKLSSAGGVQRSQVNTPVYGFDSIVVNTAAGRVDVVADPHQAQGFARIIDPSTFVFRHKLAVPHVVEVNGISQFQGSNFDGRSSRLRVYGQLFCNEPHKNGIVKLPTTLI